MHYRIYIFMLLISFSTTIIHTSDDLSPRTPITPRSPREECIGYIIRDKYIPLSLLTPIVGYRKACTLKTLSIGQRQFSLLYALYKYMPRDVFTKIVSYLYFENLFGLQQMHAQLFKKNPESITFNTSPTPTLSMLNNTTFAVAADLEPVKIWSLERKSEIFKSASISKREMCYIEPASCIISTRHNRLRKFNVITLGENQCNETTISVDNKKRIELLFPHNTHLAACNSHGTITVYDIEKATPLISFLGAHANTIMNGLQLSEHCFATGSYDGYARSFDIRTPHRVFETHIVSVPYRIARFDGQTLLLGCSTPSPLVSIDLRKPNFGQSIKNNFDMVYDLGILGDKTIVLCTNNIDFGHIEGKHFESLHTIPLPRTPGCMALSEDETIITPDDNGKIILFKPSSTEEPTCAYFKTPAAAALIGLALSGSN